MVHQEHLLLPNIPPGESPPWECLLPDIPPFGAPRPGLSISSWKLLGLLADEACAGLFEEDFTPARNDLPPISA